MKGGANRGGLPRRAPILAPWGRVGKGGLMALRDWLHPYHLQAIPKITANRALPPFAVHKGGELTSLKWFQPLKLWYGMSIGSFRQYWRFNLGNVRLILR